MIITFEAVNADLKKEILDGLQKQLLSAGFEILRTKEIGLDENDRIKTIYTNILTNPEFDLPIQEQNQIYLAARGNNVRKVQQWLKANREGIVIYDRFVDSTLAYQTNKMEAEDLQTDDFKKAVILTNYIITNHLIPDLTFFLDFEIGQSDGEQLKAIREAFLDNFDFINDNFPYWKKREIKIVSQKDVDGNLKTPIKMVNEIYQIIFNKIQDEFKEFVD